VARPLNTTPVHPIDRALESTLTTGRPTVVVVVSAAHESQKLWYGLYYASQTRDLARSGQLVALDAELNAERVRKLGVSSPPAVRGPGGGVGGRGRPGHQPRPRVARPVFPGRPPRGAPGGASAPRAALSRAGGGPPEREQSPPPRPPPPPQALPAPPPAVP